MAILPIFHFLKKYVFLSEFCPKIKKSPFLRRDLAKSLNALFRQIDSPNLPCIPELHDLTCKEVRTRISKNGKRRNIQKCSALALGHKKYIGNFKTGENCFLFFKIRYFKNSFQVDAGLKKNSLTCLFLFTKAPSKDFFDSLFKNFRQKKRRQKVKTSDKKSEEQMSTSRGTTVNNNFTSKNDSTFRPQNPAWTEWTAWSSCSKSCESGTRIRTRTCEKGLNLLIVLNLYGQG